MVGLTQVGLSKLNLKAEACDTGHQRSRGRRKRKSFGNCRKDERGVSDARIEETGSFRADREHAIRGACYLPHDARTRISDETCSFVWTLPVV
jgi:hypothetical protein